MSNEIQIVADSNPLVPAELTPHRPGHHAAHQNALWKIHRLLRGRYPLAIVLAAIFATGGAILGWRSRRPMYPSTASIQIKSTVPDSERLAHPDMVLPDYSSFIKAQLLGLTSPDVIRSALQKPQWRAIHPGPGGEAEIVAFSNNLDVTQDPPASDLIKVVYTDTNPAAAKAGVDCLCQAYLEWYQSHDPTGNGNKLRLLEHDRDSLSEQLATLKYQLDQLAEPYGGTYDLQTYLQGQFEELNKRESDVADAKLQVERVEAALKEQAATTQPANGQLPLAAMRTAPEIAQTDGTMRDLLAKRETMMEEVRRLQGQYGPNSTALQRATSDLDLLNFEIEQYVKECNEIPRTQMLIDGQPAPAQTDADLIRAKDALARITAAATEQSEKVKKTGLLYQQIQTSKEKITQLQGAYDAKVSALNDLESQVNLETDQVHVLVPADLPAEPVDRRWMLAGAGAFGAALIPTALLMLVGLFDHRYRFSDETEARSTGVPLLGILPALPELMVDNKAGPTDPEQAAIAAHCVHQVRTLLQINGPQRRVYTVTSASSGDGKTSLVLSLGLSFAASGSRTLLIDADLIGAGLTARVGVRTEEGVLEAMASGNMTPFVHATEAENLWILPVGRAMRRFPGTIAPVAVQRLVADARGRYDMILIDTGPILGSIEGSSVAAAADGVILCIARGQHRPLTDRAIAHLQAIGARMAGVVFNRAEAHDFERSVSRTVIHSLPAANGNGQVIGRVNGNRMGPIAKAVASSVRPGEEGPAVGNSESPGDDAKAEAK